MSTTPRRNTMTTTTDKPCPPIGDKLKELRADIERKGKFDEADCDDALNTLEKAFESGLISELVYLNMMVRTATNVDCPMVKLRKASPIKSIMDTMSRNMAFYHGLNTGQFSIKESVYLESTYDTPAGGNVDDAREVLQKDPHPLFKRVPLEKGTLVIGGPFVSNTINGQFDSLWDEFAKPKPIHVFATIEKTFQLTSAAMDTGKYKVETIAPIGFLSTYDKSPCISITSDKDDERPLIVCVIPAGMRASRKRLFGNEQVFFDGTDFYCSMKYIIACKWGFTWEVDPCYGKTSFFPQCIPSGVDITGEMETETYRYRTKFASLRDSVGVYVVETDKYNIVSPSLLRKIAHESSESERKKRELFATIIFSAVIPRSVDNPDKWWDVLRENLELHKEAVIDDLVKDNSSNPHKRVKIDE